MVVLEAARVGGTCVNTGCVPTRVLAKTARIIREARTGRLLPGEGDQDAAGVLRELTRTGYTGHVVIEVKTRGLSRSERSNALAVSLNFARHHLTTAVGQVR